MKVRELAALLRVLKTAGVASYESGDTKILFGGPPMPEPVASEALREELPDGVLPNVMDRLAEINRKHGGRA